MSASPNSKQTGEWFEDWFNSPYYPLLYDNRSEEEARQFVREIIHFLAPPPGARILDLACGQGRLSRQLAERGFYVTGLDIAEDAIRLAREHENDHLSFFQHDMREPFRINYFDLVFNFFTSFGYFESEKDHLDTLVNVRKGLRPGGRFVLDYLNTVKVRARLVAHNEKRVGEVQFDMHRKFEDGHFIKDIHITDGDRRLHYREKVGGFTLEEFEELFRRAGLRITHTFGDYRLGPFRPEASERLIMVAEEPGPSGPESKK